MTDAKSIRVLIADDFKLLRDVIRLSLERAADIVVIDEALDVTDALESARALRPDIIIMNDYLPPIDSAHASALFREQGVNAAILVISMEMDPAQILAAAGLELKARDAGERRQCLAPKPQRADRHQIGGGADL